MLRLLPILLLFVACVPAKKTGITSTERLQLIFDTTSAFKKSTTGFMVMDPITGDTKISYLADSYFTPASNTKILTLAASLKILGDTLDGLHWHEDKESFYFQGTGDPTFLHPSFEAWQSGLNLLAGVPPHKKLVWVQQETSIPRFGPGWAWDDYDGYYQVERSEMPVYGNTIAISANNQDGNRIWPVFFRDSIGTDQSGYLRNEFTNQLDSQLVFSSKSDLWIPFRRSVIPALLADTLHRPDLMVTSGVLKPFKTLKSTPTDTVLRLMMLESDNFLAEQLLLMAANQSLGRFQLDSLIKAVQSKILPPTPTPPRWVDGSGLSRYNLITPRYLCLVLQQLFKDTPQDRLLSFFPAGGTSGTLQHWFGNPYGPPYVFAKTGSMSGVYCLSGYILTKSGKILIFSFMNNNFVGTNKPWKTAIQEILYEIHKTY